MVIALICLCGVQTFMILGLAGYLLRKAQVERAVLLEVIATEKAPRYATKQERKEKAEVLAGSWSFEDAPEFFTPDGM